MAYLTPSPKMQFFTANGIPLVGGKLYTYVSGTTTPLATYVDQLGSASNPNPVILDSRGEAGVWLANAQLYTMVLKDSLDNLIWTSDGVGSSGVAPLASTFKVQNFSGDGTTVAFVLTHEPPDENNTQIYINGAYQQKNTYSLAASTITFSSAPPLGTDNIEVMTIATLSFGYIDSSLVNYIPAGAGAVSTTVQTKLRENKAASDYSSFSNYLSNAFSSSFYSNGGANITRLTDRVFVGGAATNDGTSNQVVNDWLSTYQNSVSRPGGPAMHFATLGVLNNISPAAPNTFVAGAQTAYLPSGTYGIAISGFGLNNNPSDNTRFVYAGYFESVREPTAPGGAYGIEIDITNYGSVIEIDPYGQSLGQTVCLQLGAGSEFPVTGQTANSAAINIQKNNGTFERGIVFGKDCLTGTNGIIGTAPAIVLAKGHGILWYGSAGIGTSAIYCTGTTSINSTTLGLNEGSVTFGNSETGKNVFAIINNLGVSGVNFPQVGPSATGNPVQYKCDGDDTNIDIQFVPKGTGTVWLGVYTAGVVAQVGYITVKDAGGVVRRLLVG